MSHVPRQEERILDEIGSSKYALVFDETPYRCACFAIGIRFLLEGKVKQ